MISSVHGEIGLKMTEEAICKWFEGDDWQYESGWSMIQPLIRCKDCKYFQSHKGKYQTWRIVNSDGICKYHNYEMTKEDDYCSHGEREE